MTRVLILCTDHSEPSILGKVGGIGPTWLRRTFGRLNVQGRDPSDGDRFRGVSSLYKQPIRGWLIRFDLHKPSSD